MWEAVETKAGKIRVAKQKKEEARRESRAKEAKSEEEVKKLVPEKFHRWIKVFSKKQLERMSIQKI